MDVRNCSELIGSFRQKRVLVVGDVMLDRFIWGSVSRISPEAPVPVVNVAKESIYPGGAANVARNLVPFAGTVGMAGLVGDDRDGETLLGVMRAGGIGVEGMLSRGDHDTITKTRVIAQHQQVVRFDRERIVAIGRAQVDEVKDYLKARVAGLDGIIIEDYGKGFVTQELVDAVVPLAKEAGVVVTVDPNPNNPLDWQGVTAVKPNRVEAFREAGVSNPHHADDGVDPLEDETLLSVGEKLLEKWGTEMVQVTLGEQGMILFIRGRQPHHVPTKAKDVFDVSGAGDTAIALFTLALTAGASAVEAAEISNFASGVVVGKLGTATLSPDELVDAIRDENEDEGEDAAEAEQMGGKGGDMKPRNLKNRSAA